MLHHRHVLSTRARRALSATTLGLLAASVAVSPASAAPGCDGTAATDLEFEEELNCATAATSGDYTITLTDSFDVTDFSFNLFEGTVPLTIQGATEAITVTGAGAGVPLDIPGFSGLIGSFLAITDLSSSPSVTVRDLHLADFARVGTIRNDSTGALVLDNVSITNGGAGREVNLGLDRGSAVASSGDVTVTGSHFEDNASWIGGAITTSLSGEASITVTDSTFEGNSAMSGGAIMAPGDATVTNSTLTGNVAIDGGAITGSGPSLTVVDSDFVGNVADAMFDGIEQFSASAGAISASRVLTITGSTFEGNTSDGFGGAIVASDLATGGAGVYSVTDSTFTANTSAFGGAAFDFAGTATLTDVTIADHEGSSAIEMFGPFAATGTTIRGNSVPGGDAVVSLNGDGAAVSLANSTVANNTAANAPAAVAIDNAASADVVHSTFVGNVNPGGDAANLSINPEIPATLTASAWVTDGEVPACAVGSQTTTAWNFDDDGSCTDGWSGAGDLGEGLDAQLGALADNGGPTATALPGAGSPLIDAVPADALVTSVDQRGIARPQGDAGDIGAVEVETATPVDPVDPQPGPEAGLVEFEIVTDTGTLHGTATPAIDVTGIQWIPVADLDTAPPADTMFPYGAAAFSVQVPQAGHSVTITLTAPRPFTTALKSGDEWTEVAGATYSQDRTTVTYTLTDGGDLDEDGTANGVIDDPIALAVQGTFTG